MSEFPKANPEIVYREEGEEALLFNPRTGDVKLLNPTGRFIFKLCDGRHSRADIADKMIESFDVDDSGRVRKDLSRFLKDLEHQGFVGTETKAKEEA